MKVTPPGSKKTRRINVVVAFVVSLFVFIWHSVVNVTVLPWLEGSVQGVTHVGLFSLLTAAGLGMYFCCVFTDPGRVPSGWLPDTESAAFVEVKKKVWALSVLLQRPATGVCRALDILHHLRGRRLVLYIRALAYTCTHSLAGRRGAILPEVQGV